MDMAEAEGRPGGFEPLFRFDFSYKVVADALAYLETPNGK